MTVSQDIPAGRCQCGCGQKTRIASRSRADRGQVKGRPLRFVHGHHLNNGQSVKPLITRFWEKVELASASECWPWVAAKTSNGYGRFWNGDRLVVAHRFAYELIVGPIPPGLELDHLCRNRACVNPAHLEPVSHRENTLRGVSFAPENSQKTQCPKGHMYDRSTKAGGRYCKRCNVESAQRSRDRNRTKDE